MRVFDIFRSIQGESSRAGWPTDFVRLAGCDLACSYCDTPQARDRSAGREMTVPGVLAAMPSPPLAWVEVTGGEPVLQLQEVNALVEALERLGRLTMIETSGAHPIEDLHPAAVRIVDVKTPGSGMADRVWWGNLDLLRPHDEVKFVLTGRADYEWAKTIVARYNLARKATVLFSPADPQLAPRDLAQWIIGDALPVRLNLQLHKCLRLP
jgi:7-carboxy-7-deazaguanine synthase